MVIIQQCWEAPFLDVSHIDVALGAAYCNQDSNVNISDVTALIDYLLSGAWN